MSSQPATPGQCRTFSEMASSPDNEDMPPSKRSVTSPMLLPVEIPGDEALPQFAQIIINKLNTVIGKIETVDNKVTAVEESVQSMKEAIDFAQDKALEAIKRCDALESEVQKMKEEKQQQQAEIDRLKHDVKTLFEKNVKYEGQSRRDNLLFTGIPEARGETPQMCKHKVWDILGMMGHRNPRSVRIARAHRLGPPRQGVTRHIIVKFEFYEDKEDVFNHRKNVPRECRIYIEEDFPKEIQQKRRQMLPILKAAQKKPEYRNAEMKADKLHINRRTYTVDTLHTLPEDIHPHTILSKSTDSAFVFFTRNSPLSNFAPFPIVVDGQKYLCNEQYIAYSKARLFKDDNAALAIMKKTAPESMKSIGKRIQGYDENTWRAKAPGVLTACNRAKYQTHPGPRAYLIATGAKTIATDSIFGTGFALQHQDATDQNKWTGSNIMGKCLMEIRATYV